MSDPPFRFNATERRVLDVLKVPVKPEPPEGSPESISVFHAGRNYYSWSLIVWATRTLLIFVGMTVLTAAVGANISKAAGWIQVAWTIFAGLARIALVLSAIVTFVARRINYRLRWYIVTDRSLRIRSGVFNVNELTMTYGNIQEIRVSAGPLQYLLGLADVEVQAAGGGGGPKQQGGGHTGRFEGLSNANDIRDLIVERLRHYRDSGLGEAPAQLPVSEVSALAAARQMLAEVRALRAALSPEQSSW